VYFLPIGMETYEGLVAKVNDELHSLRSSLKESAGQKMAIYGLLLGETRSRDVAVKSYVKLNNSMKEHRGLSNQINLCAYRNDNIGYFEDTIPLFFVDPWAAEVYIDRIKEYMARIKS